MSAIDNYLAKHDATAIDARETLFIELKVMNSVATFKSTKSSEKLRALRASICKSVYNSRYTETARKCRLSDDTIAILRSEAKILFLSHLAELHVIHSSNV